MYKKMIFLLLLLQNIFTAAAQNDRTLAFNENSPNTDYKHSQPVAVTRFTLEAFDSEQKLKSPFMEEHFLGDKMSYKWTLFMQNYKKIYEQSVGFSGSSVEILKPIIFNAVNKMNNYIRKSLKKNSISPDDASNELSHVLDCANLLCYETDTKKLEDEIKMAKSPEQLIQLFKSIQIIKH